MFGRLPGSHRRAIGEAEASKKRFRGIVDHKILGGYIDVEPGVKLIRAFEEDVNQALSTYLRQRPRRR